MATKRKPFTPPVEPVSGVAEAESIERELTVNGKPIPTEFAHAIPYEATDQGIAEKANNGKPKARCEVISDAWDKGLQRKAESEVFDSYDPLKEAVDAVRQPGMSYRFISDRVLKRRGRRGWEPAQDANNKPVVVAGMSLGMMPEKQAERRNEHYRELGNEQLRNAAQQYELDQAKAIRDAKVKGFSPLRAGETIVDNHAHPGMVTEAGIQVRRGESAA